MPADIKKDFTREEVEALIEGLRTETNVVRLVDPMSEMVLDTDGSIIPGALCNAVWGHGHRCENCSSLRALQNEETIYKMEFNKDRTFWIISRFLRVEGNPCILETVADTTDFIIIESTQLETVGEIIESYNLNVSTDSLTTAFNRNYLEDVFAPSIPFRRENDLPVHIAIMDLDRFKDINDTYGHVTGDVILADVGKFWKGKLNSRAKNREQVVVRYGGDEFVAIDCAHSFDEFRFSMANWYRSMRKSSYLQDGTEIPFSMSFGFASSTMLDGDWTWDDLFAAADANLYTAKEKRHAEMDAAKADQQ